MQHQLLTAELAADLWEEGIWPELLNYIEEERVIPIVGPDLLQVTVDGTTMLLDQYVGSRLAAMYDLPVAEDATKLSLNDVVSQLLVTHRRAELCFKIPAILAESDFTLPMPLMQLADISHFNLFVSTTFDELLESALNTVRYGGQAGTASIVYAPKKVKDLDPLTLDRATVFCLLGNVTIAPDYVICDEDMLEWVCTLQSDARRPKRLFDELKEKHLLLLGEHFPDWLARFFLRTARQDLFDRRRESVEILADNWTHRDKSLVYFLQNFRRNVKVYPRGGAVEFVDELWQRWRERNPSERSSVDSFLMPHGAVFMSYAREDTSAAQELKTGLEAAGLTVWLDTSDLRAGDDYERVIKSNVRNCSHFLAVLSKNTEQPEGWFRREWMLAIDRARGIDSSKPFIIPVVVDGTESFEFVPEEFSKRNYIRLPEGRVTPKFVSDMQKLCAS